MSTKLVGGVAVDLIARTAKWTRGFRTAQKHANSFEKAIGRQAKRIASYAAGYLAVRKLVSVFNEQRTAIDRLAKTSDKLGIPTARLTQMHHAAALSGIEVNRLNMALQRMTRRVADAAAGGKQGKLLAEAIQSIGLSARELGKLSPDEQFLRIADAMQETTDAGERVRIAFKLFDSEGVDVVNMLALGSEGLKEMYREADKLGLTIDRVAAKKVEAANDSLRRLESIATGLARSIIVELAPVIEAAATKLVQWGISGESMGTKVVNAFETMSVAVAKVLQGYDLLRAGVLYLGSAANAVASGWTMAFGGILRIIETINRAIRDVAIFFMRMKVEVIQGVADLLHKVYQITGKGLVAASKAMEAVHEATAEYADALLNRKLVDGMDTFADSVQRTADNLASAATAGAQMANAIVKSVATDERVGQVKAFYDEIKLAAEDAAEHTVQVNKKALAEQNADTKLSLEQRARLIRAHTSFIIGGLQEIVQNSRMSAKEQFEATKLLKIADTTMNTAAAIMEYHSQGRAAMAWTAGIIGAAQIAAIAGTTFEGGGSVAAPTAETAPAQEEPAARAPQQVNLILPEGVELLSRNQLIALVGQLNEANADGYILNVG